MPEGYTKVTGTLRRPALATETESTVVANGILKVFKVEKDLLISNLNYLFYSDSEGHIEFYVLRASVVYLWAQAERFDTNAKEGKAFTIPDVEEIDLDELVPAGGTIPSSAVNQTTFYAHTSKLANPDDPGHIENVGAGLVLEDGVISLGNLDSTFATDAQLTAERLLWQQGDSDTLSAANAYTDESLASFDLSLYQTRAEKNQPDGYAGLDSSGLIPDIRIPAGIARDSEVTAAIAAKQDADSDLSAIAALSPSNDDVIQRKAGAWTNRSPAQLKTDLAIAAGDVSGLTAAIDARAGVSLQPLDADLTTIAGLSPSANDVLQFVGGNWANRTAAQLKASLSLAAGDISGLGTMATQAEANYALLAGRSGGQTLYGGTASGESLTLHSTSHATKGKIFLGASSAYDGANVRLGIGTTSPGVELDVVGAGRFSGTYDFTTTNAGGYLGVISGTPRLMLANGTAAQNWQIDNSSGTLRFIVASTVQATFDSSSLYLVSKSLGVNKSSAIGAQLHVVAGSASTKGLIVQAAATPTAPWIELQDSAGTGVVDLHLDAANVLAQRNGANAQTQRWYASFTDASNYTRGSLSASTSAITLAAESAGTGSANVGITLTPKGNGNLSLNAAGSASIIANTEIIAASTQYRLDTAGLTLNSSGTLRFTPTSAANSPDTGLARSAAGVLKVTNGSSGTGFVLLAGVTFANLPATPTTGTRATVTDSTVTTFGSTIAGGGANVVPAFYNGTNWVVG